MIRATALGVTGAWILMSCASDNHAEQVRDARMAQAEEQADARESAAEENAEAREERTAEAYDQREERIDEADAPSEDTSQELNELSEERAEFQNEAREQLDKHAVQIDEAEQKIGALGPRAPHALHRELSTVQTEHGLAQQELSDLESTPASRWESDKERVEQQLEDLDSRLSDLDDQIEAQ